MTRRFAAWNGTTIHPAYQSLANIRDAVQAIAPAGSWGLAWYPKAGEGGTWQSAWDGHPLAIDGPDKLRALVREGRRLRPRLNVVPYVVVRGRADWNEAEWEQIAACAREAGEVVLNLEPGSAYWAGPTDAAELTAEYILPLKARLAGIKAKLRLAAIPRAWVFDALGGAATMVAWLYACDSASWECYGMVADDLLVDRAIPRVRAMLAAVGVQLPARYYSPIVQRGEIGTWVGTPWARYSLEVWHLDGDI